MQDDEFEEDEYLQSSILQPLNPKKDNCNKTAASNHHHHHRGNSSSSSSSGSDGNNDSSAGHNGATTTATTMATYIGPVDEFNRRHGIGTLNGTTEMFTKVGLFMGVVKAPEQ